MNLKDLSEKLRLSQTTVSRALNGYPEVNETTRKRVVEAARKHQYRPNLQARTLATGRSMSIGHIIPMSRQNELVNVVFSDFIAGAGLVYAAKGYNMTLTIVKDAGELDAYRAFAERGAIDGVIVQAPAVADRRISFLAELDIPFLVHGRASAITGRYAWLDINNERAFRELTAHLTDLGHRRIALVNGLETLDFAVCRRKGYTAGLQAVGVAPGTELMRTSDMSEPNGFVAATDLLALPDPPTAFLASSIVLALGIKRAIEARGLQIGRDVSVACFDDDLSCLPNAGDTPLFTAMRSSVRDAGARCAALLIERIASPHSPPPTELWEAEFVQGMSTGPVSTGSNA
ncbi:MAG: substrate-binding domain-containing protein [Roseobacter sp.]